jgi:hypothetical protein
VSELPPRASLKNDYAAPIPGEQSIQVSSSPQAVDASGLWADDPPIKSGSRATAGHLTQTDSNTIFGEDFEEEIPLDISNGLGRVRQIFEPRTSDASSAAYHENLAAQAAYQDSVGENRQLPSTISATNKQSSTAPTATTESLVANWTVDVNPHGPEKEFALQVEIEDLVSQLNFSAFAIEPYSVEQIEVDFKRTAAGPKRPYESQESDDREAIYTLHSDQVEQAEHIHSNLTLDDDRDLLIIEEELPVSSRGANDSIGAPIIKSAPYSQLFAKLRH